MPELNLHVLLPEFVVIGAAFAAIITELMLPAGRRATPIAWTCFAGFVVAFLILCFGHVEGTAIKVMAGEEGAEYLLTGWSSDGFAIFCRAIIAGVGALLVLLSMPYTNRLDKGHGEFYALLLFATAGVMLVSGVMDLLSLFVCLELVTIMAFILAALKRNDLRSTEAGLKYLVIGAVSTALLLLGIAFIYGQTGSLSFERISEFTGDAALAGKDGILMHLGLALALTGLLFKLGGVPFHVWIPDVYQGAPTPVTAFLATASKAAGLILLIRVAVDIVVPAEMLEGVSWVAMLAIVAIVTLLFGTLAAIPQRNIKRLLAYSSVGHAGYLLIGLAAVVGAGLEGQEAVTALLYYLMAYMVTNVTAFAVIVLVSASLGTHESRAYSGLAQRAPFLAFAMTLALLSLAGVPPMSGFFGKFLILKAAVESDLTYLAVVGAIGVVISLYFYLLWIKEMYFKAPEDEDGGVGGALTPIPIPRQALVVLSIGIVGMLLMGVWMTPFHQWAHDAAAALFP